MDNKKNKASWRWRRGLFPIGLAFALTFLLGTLLTACTKVEVTPPAYQLKLSESKQLRSDYNRAWARAIGWFDANELAIERIDEKTGYIEGTLPMQQETPYLDCGSISFRNVVGKPKMQKAGRVRIIIRGQRAPTASVTIFTTGTYRVSIKDPYAGREVYRSGPCTSSGELERRIFSFLDS
jgi:hypothetical protein